MKTEKYQICKLFMSWFIYFYEGKYDSYFSQNKWTLYNKKDAIQMARCIARDQPEETIYIKNFNSGDILMTFTKGEPNG